MHKRGHIDVNKKSRVAGDFRRFGAHVKSL